MSYISLPRVHFVGKLSVDIPLANNFDQLHERDAVRLKFGTPSIPDLPNVVIPSDFSPGLPIPPSDPGFDQYRELQDRYDQFQNWRDGVRNTLAANLQQLYMGNNALRFVEAKITTVELPSGDIISDIAQDSLIGAEVELLGSKRFDRRSHAVLVDHNPTGTTSQIYSGLFRLNKDEQVLLSGEKPTRAHLNWLHPTRNLAIDNDSPDSTSAAVFQFGILNEALSFAAEDADQSPALSALRYSAAAGQGLLVRFCTYLIPYRRDRTVPSMLMLVGSIGAWEKDEISSVPTGRLLYPLPAEPFPFPSGVSPTLPPNQRQFWVGPTVAKVDHNRQVVTLDMINAIPEPTYVNMTMAEPTEAPEKHNFGTLTLGLMQPGQTTPIAIGAIPFDQYNQAAYLRRAGLVELPYPADIDAETLDQGDLVLIDGDLATGNWRRMLVENAISIHTDNRNLYLDLDDTATITLQVLQRGSLPSVPITVTLIHRSLEARNTDPRIAVWQPNTPHLELSTQQVTIDASGKATFSIHAKHAGLSRITFWVPTNIPSGRLADLLDFYIDVRVLPADDFDDIDDETLWNDWLIVYKNVFAYYDILFPIMSRLIDFSNPAEVRRDTNPGLIKTYTSPEGFESSLFMPVSRDMSRGKRKLLHRWCSLAESDGPTR